MEENKAKKCSSKKHAEIDAIYYCLECRVYMCNKCETFHSDLFPNHNPYNLNKNTIISSIVYVRKITIQIF